MKKIFLQPISARGQSLVEFAISLLILLYLISGAAEFGILFFQYIQLRDAAQEGALYGSLHPSDTAGMITRIQNSSDKPLDLKSAAVTIEIYIDDNPNDTSDGIPYTDATNYPKKACEGHGLKVIAQYDHKIFMPFIPKLIRTDKIRLRAVVTDTILTPAPTASAPLGSCK